MATNKLINFGTWSLDSQNTYTDDELVALTSTEKEGIQLGSIAYSDILNGLIRQVTKTNKVFGDLIVEKSAQNINTGLTDAVYKARMELAIENIAKEVAVTKLVIPPTANTNGAVKITFDGQGLVTGTATFGLTDFPSIAQNTFLGRTASGAGAPSAITATTVLTTIGAVPNTRTVAGAALSADVTRDTIIGVSAAGFVKRGSSANTYTTSSTVAISELANIDSGRFLGRTASGIGAVSALSRDSVIGITTGTGLIKRTAANTYEIYSLVPDDIPTLDQSKITSLVDDLAAKVPTARTLAGLDLTANRSRDDLIGISGASGVVIKTEANTYGVSDAYALTDNVALKASGSPTVPKIWVGTETQYNAVDPKVADVVYIII